MGLGQVNSTFLKYWIALFTPPVIIKIYKKLFYNPEIVTQPEKKYGWFGKFESFDEVKKEAKGYEDQLIFNKALQSVMAVKKGKASFERDTVLFYKEEFIWPVVTCILHAHSQSKNQLQIIDFGGAFGSTYFQNRKFFSHLDNWKWTVVEQPHFVKTGKEQLQDEHLYFAINLEECYEASKKPILLLSSVLQYIENPYECIKYLLNFDFEHIIIDRNAFLQSEEERITIQKVPPEIYEASYPCYFFSESKFLKAFMEQYYIFAEFPSSTDNDGITDDGIRIYWKGFYLIRKPKNET